MKLFEPIVIRSMQLRNRIIMPPMGTNFRIRNPKARDYYVERAKGGIGAILIGGFPVDTLSNDEFAKDIRTWLIDPVHEYGAKIGPQLFQSNQYPSLGAKGIGPQWVAPSPGRPLGTAEILPAIRPATEYHCRELTVAEIQDIISRFARASAKSREVGFDLIELHACHGHNLPHQFFSPLDNRRNDVYGGNLAGRMRFGIEIAKAIRVAVGNDFPFFWRLSAEEGLPGGYTLEECLQYAAILVKAGVDVIDVSFGHEAIYEPAPANPACPYANAPMGTFVHFAEEFKRRLFVPVVAVGRIHSPEVAEDILSQGKADLVAIGRQLLADPHWPEKIADGKLEDVRPCLSCNTCVNTFSIGKPIECTVNSFMGREHEFKISPAEKIKKVFIVGGGPAGMEAARIAALRGHQVTLIEREDKLGGQLNIAALPPHKQRIKDLIEYLSIQLEKNGVQVRLETKATANFIEGNKPDAIILATGGRPLILDIPGVKTNNVVTAIDALTNGIAAGERVIVLGGELVACDTAEFLAENGKKVIITRRGPVIAAESFSLDRQFLLYRLGSRGVIMLTSVTYKEITEKGLAIITKTGKEVFIEADTIVLATGAEPNNEMAQELNGKVPELYSIGDCVKPRRIINAIEEGTRIGLNL